MIELELDPLQDKLTILEGLNLKEDCPPIANKMVSEEEPTESQEEGSSHVEDSEKEKEKMKI